ncbi:glycine betaine transporter OpuD [Pigmentiphaga litoralis]|uniref:BCCT family transporter n=1 Tax=Pigmentiphaga litoralis TaxID=516702 RepID=UPI0016780E93|nr:BCCT family transporter [Pigmentiphaga litoralis]GGX13135.1 glycine betaine transporter OpuD [Pigmentiphaga litoralis]
MALWSSLALVGLFVIWALASPTSMSGAMDAILAFSTRSFGWFYLWVVFALVLVCFFLVCSRFGNIRLGGDDEKPVYDRKSWFSMLFAAGMGIGLMFWGVAEPVSHYLQPPPGVEPVTAAAANASMRYTFFHWGLHPWAIYCTFGMAVAFFQFRRQAPMTISSTLGGLPERWRGKWIVIVDILALVATAFGIATSLGFGAMQINSGLAQLFGVPVGPTAQIVIIVCATVAFLTSALSGLDRGVKLLSNFNLLLAVVLAAVVFVVGPTAAILDTLTTSLGGYISEFVRMSLRLTPFTGGGWFADWTIFYWAWWIAWAPYVGLFIARISRGRTIREFLIGAMFVPALTCFIWFSIFGGSALHFDIFQNAGIGQAALKEPSSALFMLFDYLPMKALLSGVATVLVVVFFVTSGDSGVFVMGVISNGGKGDPSAKLKLVWGILIALIAIALLLAGGLEAVQAMTIVMALPFTVVLVVVVTSTLRAIMQDQTEIDETEEALHRALHSQEVRDIVKQHLRARAGKAPDAPR